MTADEIIFLVFEYEWAVRRCDSTAAEEAAEVNFKEAIHQVVGERDALLKALSEGREAWAFIEHEMQNEIIELRAERDDARVECERMSWRNP